MTLPRNSAAKRHFKHDKIDLCPTCRGSGLATSPSVVARARKGGTASFLASLGNGRLSMSDRGKRGGRPKEHTLDDLAAMGRGTGTP